jgi:2-succinyl-5-enolpyruvyl-6-hydroxy-3-cyclohexene-1-carboxylate synthase
MYSVVDERSAGYVALGLAAATGVPVVLSCTGATASRNYMSAMTEAYYRKLPVIAVTSLTDHRRVGHLVPQAIDRSCPPHDVAVLSVQLPTLRPGDDPDACALLVNQAILAAKRRGGGPVHINLSTSHTGSFQTRTLPSFRVVRGHSAEDVRKREGIPSAEELTSRRVAVFVGSHAPFSTRLARAVEEFSEVFDAPILVDHTSGYGGPASVLSAYPASVVSIPQAVAKRLTPQVIVHVGEVSGDYATTSLLPKTGAVTWRVSLDGEARDLFGKLEHVFETPEELFFEEYTEMARDRGRKTPTDVYRAAWRLADKPRVLPPALPLSAPYIAAMLHDRLPRGCALHLAILNSLRNWNLFHIDPSISVSANVGGFGIDGPVSTALGMSLADPNRLCFAIVGDLAFFYDMNVLGNRHVGRNMRVLLINNGLGAEFKLTSHIASRMGGDEDPFVAAAGHFGSAEAWATSSGFRYLSANTKETFVNQLEEFVQPELELAQHPMLFEVFVSPHDEATALDAFLHYNGLSQRYTALKRAIPPGLRSRAKIALMRSRG